MVVARAQNLDAGSTSGPTASMMLASVVTLGYRAGSATTSVSRWLVSEPCAFQQLPVGAGSSDLAKRLLFRSRRSMSDWAGLGDERGPPGDCRGGRDAAGTIFS